MGVGVGRGEATVYLVDTKAAEALSEADEREAAKVNNRGRIAVEYVLTLTDRRKNERK